MGSHNVSRITDMATNTITTAPEAGNKSTAPATSIARNPKDSMKSTWRTWDRKTWNHEQKIMDLLGLHPTDLNREVPVFAKTDQMACVPHMEGHKWILFHALWPLLVHQAYIYITGKNNALGCCLFILLHHLQVQRHSRDPQDARARSSVWIPRRPQSALSSVVSWPMRQVKIPFRHSAGISLLRLALTVLFWTSGSTGTTGSCTRTRPSGPSTEPIT